MCIILWEMGGYMADKLLKTSKHKKEVEPTNRHLLKKQISGREKNIKDKDGFLKHLVQLLCGGGGLVFIFTILIPIFFGPNTTQTVMPEGSVDARDLSMWVGKLSSKDSEGKKREVERWYKKDRCISPSLKEALLVVIEGTGDDNKPREHYLEMLQKEGKGDVAGKVKEALTIHQSENAKGAIISAIIAADSIVNYDARRTLIQNYIDLIHDPFTSQQSVIGQKNSIENYQRLKSEIQGLSKTILCLYRFYCARVKECCYFKDDVIDDQLKGVSYEMAPLEEANNAFVKHRITLANHIALYRNTPNELENPIKIMNEIRAENLR